MGEQEESGELEDREIGPVTVLFGNRGGKYPDGNSLLLRGERERAIVDPSLGVARRGDALSAIDRVFFSHCHEDHLAGSHVFGELPWHVHREDRPGFDSIEAMMAIYGLPEPQAGAFRKRVLETFHYQPHAQTLPFEDGDEFDLGGLWLTVVHTPGHTRGHSCLLIEWGRRTREERLLYLGDIELSSFGPYYGDAWSDLEDYERSLKQVREIDARWYATFHHIGVLERDAFLARLDRFEAKIEERESRLLEFLAEPRTIEEVVAHRFVYRPGDAVGLVDPIERRSMSMHIERLMAAGRVARVEGKKAREGKDAGAGKEGKDSRFRVA